MRARNLEGACPSLPEGQANRSLDAHRPVQIWPRASRQSSATPWATSAGQAVGERALRQARQFSRPQRHRQDPTSSKAHSDEAASSSRARHMEADSLA